MKKVLTLFIIFSLTLLPSLAISELYNLKNTTRGNVSSVVSSVLVSKNYTIQKFDPYLAYKNNTPLVIIIQQNGLDSYLYIQSENSIRSVKNSILKNFNAYQIQDTNYISIFNNSANMLISGKTKVYNFNNENQTKTVSVPGQNFYLNNSLIQNNGQYKPLNSSTNQMPQNFTPNNQNSTRQYQNNLNHTYMDNISPMQGYVGRIGKGQILKAYIQNPLNTATALKGDSVVAVLEENWVTPNGKVIAEQGSVLDGTVTKAIPAKIGMRNAKISFTFNRLSAPSGQIYSITTKSIDFVVDNNGRLTAAKKVIGSSIGGALIGAALGGISALISGDANAIWHGAIVGAGITGVSSTVGVVTEKGVDVEIPAFTQIEIELDSDIDVTVN